MKRVSLCRVAVDWPAEGQAGGSGMGTWKFWHYLGWRETGNGSVNYLSIFDFEGRSLLNLQRHAKLIAVVPLNFHAQTSATNALCDEYERSTGNTWGDQG